MMEPDAYTTGQMDGLTPLEELPSVVGNHFQIALSGSVLVPSTTSEKEHYAYQIEVNTNLPEYHNQPYFVQRRFQDFYDLHEKLSGLYSLPPMPKKEFFWNWNSGQIIQQRTGMFSEIIAAIGQQPELQCHPLVVDFLSTSHDRTSTPTKKLIQPKRTMKHQKALSLQVLITQKHYDSFFGLGSTHSQTLYGPAVNYVPNPQAQQTTLLEDIDNSSRETKIPTDLPPIKLIDTSSFRGAILWVRVISATNLPEALLGSRNAFCTLKMMDNGDEFTWRDNSRQRTKIVSSSLSPNWNQDFSFRISSLKESILMNVRDYFSISKNILLGSIVVPLGSMKTMNELVFFESELEDSDKRLAGRIFFELMLTEPPSYDHFVGDLTDNGNLFVGLIEAKELINVTLLPNSKANTYAVVQVEDEKDTRKRSKTIVQSQNPYWKDEFLLNLSKLGRRSNLRIEVFYESVLTSSLDSPMGWVTVPLHEIYDGIAFQKWLKLKDVAQGEIYLTLYFQPESVKITQEAWRLGMEEAYLHYNNFLSAFSALPQFNFERCFAIYRKKIGLDIGPHIKNEKYETANSKKVNHSLAVNGLGQVIAMPHEAKSSKKLVSLVVDTSGKNGRDGFRGDNGRDGHSGCAGSFGGGSGSRGSDGGNATNGASGHNGEHALPITQTFSQMEPVQADGSCVVALRGQPDILSANLPSCFAADSKIAFNASGGHGGRGGNGGVGGHGGAGGHGGDGHHGATGGFNGGDGGPGGCGGNGGNGGNGGFGGSGGNAGNAAPVTLSTTVAANLILFDSADVSGGSGGYGGVGGSGGDGGRGGTGGSGGCGGAAGSRDVPQTITRTENGQTVRETIWRKEYGHSGHTGRHGLSGAKGHHGIRGSDGPNGVNGNPAAVTFQIVDPMTNLVMETSNALFDLTVMSYNVSEGASAVQDGIFEPGQEIVLTEFVLTNAGGLTFPPGAFLSILSTKYIVKFPQQFIVLPAIRPGEIVVIQGALHAFLYNFALPAQPSAFYKEIKLVTTCELLSRHVPRSSPVARVRCRYPICIVSDASLETIAHNETTELTVVIQNISTATYGVSNETAIDLVFITEQGLYMAHSAPSDVDPLYSQVVVPLTPLMAGEQRTVSLSAVMLPEVMHFERKKWRAVLRLRGQAIQYSEKLVRCAALWTEFPSVPAIDMVLFVGDSFTPDHLVLWKKLALGFRFNVRIWDYLYYNGVSYNITTGVDYSRDSPLPSWKRYQNELSPLLIFLFNPKSKLESTRFAPHHWGLRYSDIIQHFPYQEEKRSLFQNFTLCNRFDDGCIFFGYTPRKLVECIGFESPSVDLESQNIKFGASHAGLLSKDPLLDDAIKKVKEIIDKFKEVDHTHHYTVKNFTIDFQRDPQEKDYWNYGELLISQVALPMTSRILGIPSDVYLNAFSSDHLHATLFPERSGFFTILSNLFFSISLKHKLLMLVQASARGLPVLDWVFEARQGLQLAVDDIFCLGFYIELYADLVAKDTQYTTTFALLSLLSSDKSLYCITYIVTVLIYALERMKDNFGFFTSAGQFTALHLQLLALFASSLGPTELNAATESAKRLRERHAKDDIKQVFSDLLNTHMNYRWGLEFAVK